MAGGTIEGFATYMTGDFYGALTEHTILGKLAEEPEDEAGFARGLEASKRPGGLTHLAFSARTLVLMGELPGAQVMPYISGMLIGYEVAHALSLAAAPQVGGSARDVVVISEGSVARFYQLALAAHGLQCRVLSPEAVFVTGLLRILEAA